MSKTMTRWGLLGWLLLAAAATAQEAEPTPAPTRESTLETVQQANDLLVQAMAKAAEGTSWKAQHPDEEAGPPELDEGAQLWQQADGQLAPLKWGEFAAELQVAAALTSAREAKQALLQAAKVKPQNPGAIDLLTQAPPGVGQEWFAHRIFVPLHGATFWVAVFVTIALWFLLLAGLQQLDAAGRRRLTVAVTFVAGLFYSVSFFTPRAINPVKSYETPLGRFMLCMGAFTIGLGVINLVAVHGKALLRRRGGWINSLAFFVGFLGMITFGFWNMQNEEAMPEVGPDGNAVVQTMVSVPEAGYRLVFEGLLRPLQSTTFALLGFMIVSAAYRAFRVQNTEAALMTIIAFVVMLGGVPMGQWLTHWLPLDGPWSYLRIEKITEWMLTVPNAAAFRGILFGAATGSFALALRVWLSLERGPYLGKEF